MMPLNSKSLFAHLCMTMERLDSNEIDVNTANSHSKLVGQAVNLLNYELKRALILSNKNVADEHRNLEIKKFDSLPE